MKHLAKRSLSVLLVMALCISLLSGLVFAANGAQITYVTGDAKGFSDVIKNWGQRGTTATFLSPNAEDFYAENNTTYSELSVLSSSVLKSTLKELMASNHKVITSYGDTRDLYRFTDCQNSNSSSISSFYSGKSIGPAWDSGATWNREHTWPNSKGLNGSDEDDIMMLRPTASSENSARGNTAYGESAGYYDPNAISGGTYNLHGDVARIMLYVYVRWGNSNIWGSGGVIESKELLLKWMQEDPVDTWELGRNDSVESITGTRNVFVDYPELAFIMLGDEVPADMVTPSGEAFGGHTITAKANNSALGSVVVSGCTITAYPAEGCRVAGYTVTSGNARVTWAGNVFTVNASSDCTICVNFESKDGVTVSFMENGTVAGSQAAYYGDVITLPNHSGAVAEGYFFEGWVDTKLNETSVAPGTLYSAGSGYTVKKDVTLYALYSRFDSGSVGQSSVYELFTGVPNVGDYLIVSDGGALKASLTKSRFDYRDVTINNGSIVNPAADIIWHIEPADGGSFTIYNESTGSYAGGTGAKSKGALLSTVTDYAKWTISAGQVFENIGNKNNGVNYTLRRNADFGFACYAAITGTGITLYKQAGGTVYYTTSIGNGCQHINSNDVAAKKPGCTTLGYTAGVYCNDCKSYVSGHKQVNAAGHKYTAVVTPATQTERGYTTYTCSVCGDSYVADYTDALQGEYEVSFVVPAGVTAVEAVKCGTNGIVLPAAEPPAGTFEYTFAGWVMTEVDNADAKPEFMTAGSQFTSQANVALYALYSFVPDGSDTVYYTTVIHCVHSGELVPAVPADCENVGNIAHYLCDSCGKFFADAEFTDELESVVDPQKGHTFGDFLTDENCHWKSCAYCAKEELDTHSYGEWEVVQEAKPGVEGSRERTCDICGYKLTERIPAESVPQAFNGWIILWIVLIVGAIGVTVVLIFVMKKKKV